MPAWKAGELLAHVGSNPTLGVSIIRCQMKKTNLYSDLAKICVKFYELSTNANEISGFIEHRVSRFKPKKILFIGGFFFVAKELVKRGYDMTIVDYTDEMVDEGKKLLPNIRIIKADIRKLPFENEFDAVLVIGRVFTHMYSDKDLENALQNIRKSLKSDGILLFDNYENTKIMKTKYFNGKIDVRDKNIRIIRNSSTEQLSKKPFIVNWKANYTVKEKDNTKTFRDEMRHRAFSRSEIREILGKNDFEFIEEGKNFDETSFYTVAKKSNSPNVVVKKSKIQGKGVFAVRDFKKGEIVLKWEKPHFITEKEYHKLPKKDRKYVDVLKGKYILMQIPERYVNHSCDANTYMGKFCDIAKRNIKKGEEITADYSEEVAMDFKMRCRCGSKNCRRIITRTGAKNIKKQNKYNYGK